MKKTFISAVIFLSATFSAQSIINNQSLVEMKKAGLSEEIIKSKIATEESNFDVSTDAILELKKEGFSDETISLMMQKNQALKAYSERTGTNVTNSEADRIFQSIEEKNGQLELKSVSGKTYTIAKTDELQIYLPASGQDFLTIKQKKSGLNAKLLGKVADVVGAGAMAVGVGSNNMGTVIGATKVLQKANAVSYGADALERVQDLPISKNAKLIAGKKLSVTGWKQTEDGLIIEGELQKKKYEVMLQDALMIGEVKF